MRYKHKDIEAIQWNGDCKVIEELFGASAIVQKDDRSVILQGGHHVKAGDFIQMWGKILTIWDQADFEERYELLPDQKEEKFVPQQGTQARKAKK